MRLTMSITSEVITACTLILLSLFGCEGESSQREKIAGEVSAGEVSAGEMSAGEMSAGEVSAGEVSAGVVSAGEMSAGETSAGETSAGESAGVEAGVMSAGEQMGGTQTSSLNSAVDAAVEDFLNANTALEGAAVIIVHGERGVLHRRAYGAFDEERVYFVASSSKMVAAGIINHLHDQGVMDMYAPIVESVDWGRAHPEIQPVHLISNSSGLPGLDSMTAGRGHICQFFSRGSLQECARTIFEAAPDGGDTIVPPDTEFRYGGGQWQVAGGIAERVSGRSWNQLFEEVYATPCGLTSSGFSHQGQFAQEGFSYPTGFGADINNLAPTENPWIEGGLYTTIDDYGKLLMMHLRGGRCGETTVHPAETIRRMHADRILEEYMGDTGNAILGGYGMGWWVDRSREGVVHDPGAYGSWAYIDHTRNLAVFTVLEATILPEGFGLHNQLRPVIERGVDDL